MRNGELGKENAGFITRSVSKGLLMASIDNRNFDRRMPLASISGWDVLHSPFSFLYSFLVPHSLFPIFLLFTISLLQAHEGHQPLPSKGVQVDSERGYITLSGQARSAIGLATEEIKVGEVEKTLSLYAETVSPWQSKAFGSAQVSGRITKLLVRPGDIVAKGQIVAELTSRELEMLRLEYAQAKKETELNQQLLELSRPSADSGAVPRQRILELENVLLQSQNNLAIARISAKTLGIEVNQLDQSESRELLHEIRSPIAGKIVHSDLSEGKFVEAFEHLFEIVNNDTVWVKLQLLEKDFYNVEINQQVALTFPDVGVTIQSRIERLDVVLDPKSKVGWAWTTVANSSILPGMVGNARVQIAHQDDRLSIPTQSVFSDGLQSYVFVEEASTKASAEYRKRNVSVGKRKLVGSDPKVTFIEVLQGEVYPGDRVVTKGGHELSSLFFLGVLKLSDQDRSRLGIRTATAHKRPISKTLDLAAIVSLPPEHRSVVSSQLNGTIHSHRLSPGQAIKKGDLLMELVSPEFYAVQLDLLRSILDANLTRGRARRLEEVRNDAFSRRVLLETIAKAEQLEQRVESLQRQLASLGLSKAEVDSVSQSKDIIQYLPIRAEIDGNLASWVGNLGETVTANQSLVEIENLESIWIEAYVPLSDMQSIDMSRVGHAMLLSNPEIRFPVSVARIGPIASESTRTQSIWLTPSHTTNSVRLRNRMQLSVTLETGEAIDELAIPFTAILRDGLHKFVFVQKSDGYIERRRVTTGPSDGQWVAITSGLVAGDEAIIAGGRELQTAFASLR